VTNMIHDNERSTIPAVLVCSRFGFRSCACLRLSRRICNVVDIQSNLEIEQERIYPECSVEAQTGTGKGTPDAISESEIDENRNVADAWNRDDWLHHVVVDDPYSAERNRKREKFCRKRRAKSKPRCTGNQMAAFVFLQENGNGEDGIPMEAAVQEARENRRPSKGAAR
jgi:hypothetical protein